MTQHGSRKAVCGSLLRELALKIAGALPGCLTVAQQHGLHPMGAEDPGKRGMHSQWADQICLLSCSGCVQLA